MVTALAAKTREGGRIFVTDVVAARLDLAHELGFEALDASDPGLARLILNVPHGEGADVVFECTGAPPAALQMTEFVRCKGSIVNAEYSKRLSK